MKNKFPDLLDQKDRLLFYYSGHGGDSGGKSGYMQFSKAEHNSFAGNQVLKIRDIEDWCSEINISHLLFILDCCASGLAFTPKGVGSGIKMLLNTLSGTGKMGIEAYFETKQLKELVAKAQSIIEQRKFNIDFSQFGIDVEQYPLMIRLALKMMKPDFLKIKTVPEIAEKVQATGWKVP